MKSIKLIIPYIFIILVLYMYVFNPYPFRGGVIKLLYPLALLPFASNNGRIEIKKNRKIIFSLFLLFLYDVFLLLVFGSSRYLGSFLNIIELVFVPIGLCMLYEKLLLTRDLMKDLVVVCSGAAIITVFLALNQELAFAVRYIFNSNTAHIEEVTRRMYGISEYLLFTYSVLLGFVAGYCLTSKGVLVKLTSLLLLLGVVLNARIGLAVFFVVVIIRSLSYKAIKNNILFVFFLLLVAPLIYDWFVVSFPDTYEWLAEGYEETMELSHGNKTGTFAGLNDMLVLPSNLTEWVCGTGKDLLREYHNSDIGYFRQLYYGGLVYLCLISYFFVLVLRKANKVFSDRMLVVGVIVTLLIANYKGDVLSSNEFVRFFILMTIFYSMIQTKGITTDNSRIYG